MIKLKGAVAKIPQNGLESRICLEEQALAQIFRYGTSRNNNSSQHSE